MSIVNVRLMEDKTRPVGRRRFIRVEVESSRKLAVGGVLKKQADIFPHECHSEGEFERKIMVLAGAMAEMLDEQYGEGHDPSECVKMAREGYRELRMDGLMYEAPPQERGEGEQ
jgi:hypothetical protein